MNLNEFIQKCKTHNFNYRSPTNPLEAALYKLYKAEEYELISEVTRNPEWAEIYLAYKRGVNPFEVNAA